MGSLIWDQFPLFVQYWGKNVRQQPRNRAPNAWSCADANPSGYAGPLWGLSILVKPLPQTKNNHPYINKRKYIFNMPQKTTFLLGFRALSASQPADPRVAATRGGTFHHGQAAVTSGDI